MKRRHSPFFPPFLTSCPHLLAPGTRETRIEAAIWEQGGGVGRKGVWTGERCEAAAGRAGEAAGPPAWSRPGEDACCPGTLRAEPKTPGPAQQGESAGWHSWAWDRVTALLSSPSWAKEWESSHFQENKQFCLWSCYTGALLRHAAFKLILHL